MGYMDVGGVRYFDIRDLTDIYLPVTPLGAEYGSLPSDSTRRLDSLALKAGPVQEAQRMKETLEEAQRHDRRLREACHTRRSKGGPKFAGGV